MRLMNEGALITYWNTVFWHVLILQRARAAIKKNPMIIHRNPFHLCYPSTGATLVINLCCLQMSACHSEEITPDLCVSSITNVDAALQEKCFSCGAASTGECPGGIPCAVFTVADASANPWKTFLTNCDRARSISTGTSSRRRFIPFQKTSIRRWLTCFYFNWPEPEMKK